MCVKGADVIRDEVILKLRGKPLSTYSVFIPMVETDAKAPAEKAAKGLAKHGVRSYWDGNRKLGAAYAKLFGNPDGLKVAWDVYFIYGPNAVWGKSPPKPSYYMHQLKENDPLCLDGPKFRQAVEKELKKVKLSQKLVLLTREGCTGTASMRKNLDAALKNLPGYTYELVDLGKLPHGDPRRGYPTPTLLKDGRDVFGMPAPKRAADPPS